MKANKKEEPSLLSSIHLIDHSFVSRLIGKYSWSMQSNAPRSKLDFHEEGGRGTVHITEHTSRIEIKQIVQPLHIQLIYRSAELLSLVQGRAQALSSLLQQTQNRNHVDGIEKVSTTTPVSGRRYIKPPEKLANAPYSAHYPLLHRIEQERVTGRKLQASQQLLRELSSPVMSDAADYAVMLEQVQSIARSMSSDDPKLARQNASTDSRKSEKTSPLNQGDQASRDEVEMASIAIKWSERIQQTLDIQKQSVKQNVKQNVKQSGIEDKSVSLDHTSSLESKEHHVVTLPAANERTTVQRRRAILQPKSTTRLTMTNKIEERLLISMTTSNRQHLRSLHWDLMRSKQQLVIERRDRDNQPLQLIYKVEEKNSSLHERKVSRVHRKDVDRSLTSRGLQHKDEEGATRRPLKRDQRNVPRHPKLQVAADDLTRRLGDSIRAQLIIEHGISQPFSPLSKRISENQMIKLRTWNKSLSEQGERVISLWTRIDETLKTPTLNIRLVHRRLSSLHQQQVVEHTTRQQIERHDHKQQMTTVQQVKRVDSDMTVGNNSSQHPSSLTKDMKYLVRKDDKLSHFFLSKRAGVERILQQYVEAKQRQDTLVYNRHPASFELTGSNRNITILTVVPARMIKHSNSRQIMLKQHWGMELHTIYHAKLGHSAATYSLDMVGHRRSNHSADIIPGSLLGSKFLKLYYRPSDAETVSSVRSKGDPNENSERSTVVALKPTSHNTRTRLLRTIISEMSLLSKRPSSIASKQRLASTNETIRAVQNIQQTQMQVHRDQQFIQQELVQKNEQANRQKYERSRNQVIQQGQELRYKQEVGQQHDPDATSAQYDGVTQKVIAQAERILKPVIDNRLQETIQHKLSSLVKIKNVVLSSSGQRLAEIVLKQQQGQFVAEQDINVILRPSLLHMNSMITKNGMLSTTAMVAHARIQRKPATQAVLAPSARMQSIPATQAVLAPPARMQSVPATETVLAPPARMQSIPATQTVLAPQARIQPTQPIVTNMSPQTHIQLQQWSGPVMTTSQPGVQLEQLKPLELRQQSKQSTTTSMIALRHSSMLSRVNHKLTSTSTVQVNHRNQPSARLDVKKEANTTPPIEGMQQLQQTVQVLEQKLKDQQDKLVKQNTVVPTRQLVDQLYDELSRKLRMEAKRHGR